MKNELHKTQNEIVNLSDLPDTCYERIFNMYKEGDFYSYNIIRNIKIPADLDDSFFYYLRITGNHAWPQLSQRIYGTIRLWWLLCTVNGIMNPVTIPDPGLVIKVIKPEYVPQILGIINRQI